MVKNQSINCMSGKKIKCEMTPFAFMVIILSLLKLQDKLKSS